MLKVIGDHQENTIEQAKNVLNKAAGGRFTQEIQAALLQLGARPDTIVSFTPNWKSY